MENKTNRPARENNHNNNIFIYTLIYEKKFSFKIK